MKKHTRLNNDTKIRILVVQWLCTISAKVAREFLRRRDWGDLGFQEIESVNE